MVYWWGGDWLGHGIQYYLELRWRSRWTLNVAYAEEPPATNENYDKVLSLRGATPATGSGYKNSPAGLLIIDLKNLLSAAAKYPFYLLERPLKKSRERDWGVGVSYM